MKFWKKLGIVLACTFVLFGVYYGSYRFYQYKYGNKDKEKFAQQLSDKTLEVNSAEENIITQRTKLTIEYYDRITGMIEVEQTNMPVEYIGMSREELIDYLLDYAKDPNLEDIEAGFEKYQIMSFSSTKVVLRKILAPSKIAHKYYLVEEAGCVTVYYMDRKTVYEYSNIIVDLLPEDIRDKVKQGMYLTDEDALYDFLETYTS